jgi:hypothetical protein
MLSTLARAVCFALAAAIAVPAAAQQWPTKPVVKDNGIKPD